MTETTTWFTLMAPQDKDFYKQLGKRIAQVRKQQSLTQVQLAEILGIAQQTMAHYEGGSLRISIALLTMLMDKLHISFDELIESPDQAAKKKRGPASKLERQIEQVRELPRTKQKFVIEMIDTVIQQQQAS